MSLQIVLINLNCCKKIIQSTISTFNILTNTHWIGKLEFLQNFSGKFAISSASWPNRIKSGTVCALFNEVWQSVSVWWIFVDLWLVLCTDKVFKLIVVRLWKECFAGICGPGLIFQSFDFSLKELTEN